MNNIQQVQQLGQSVWLDYIRRGLIKSGELKQLIDEGISGLTSNPTILEKAIIGSTDYDDELIKLAEAKKTDEQIYEIMAMEDIRSAADLLRPIYDRTAGADGFPSFEISPLLAYDTAGSIKEAKRLFTALQRPNVMVKVPATPQGIPAIRELISEGINVNVTLIFSLQMYDRVKEAYISGLEDLAKKGGDPTKVASVASFFLSRIDTMVDNQLEELVKKGRADLKPFQGKAAIASAKIAHKNFRNTFYGERFAALKAKKAHAQRLLWASTSTKNPAYSDVKYVEPLIGPDTVNTLPLVTIHAFLEHGKAERTIEQGIPDAEQAFEQLKQAGIDMDAVTGKLMADGVKAFEDSFNKLMAGIKDKKSRLVPAEPEIETNLAEYDSNVKSRIAELTQANLVKRIWRKDYTVWKPEPSEITNRLGWLTVTETMHEQVPVLQAFAQEVKDAGFRFSVLLGMGGSSLCAEVLRQVFGSASGFPELFVLDSTIPDTIQAVRDAVDISRTLFIVASKSGTTTEPNILYKYFKQAVENAGKSNPGENFIAVTDPGTPLASLGEKDKFRKVFLNPPDIGGRYSVLSYFGLVPGALIGADIKALLDYADTMRESCAYYVPGHENPGLWLGTCMGTLAASSRDKLTLVTSPSLGSFGLWVEQLIAESTGKNGKGILPVAGEPLLAPENYGADRLFVYLRLKSDNNESIDAAVNALKPSQPVIVLEMNDKLDLGAEFFRWEFATAVAGKILGIHPFDQPDVQRAKDETERLLGEYVRTKRLPQIKSTESVSELVSRANPGEYFAVMAYLRQTNEIDTAFTELRKKVIEEHHIATTLGYGPRFLHSTGQLHKGGRNNGLFLQITADHKTDLSIPDEAYTFGVVADAQALGDLQALQALGRRVVSVRLKQADAASIGKLIK
jgi:transaldolase/glucose-6-phosphate isomerase